MTPDELRASALALPETEERETWGEATFRVRGKIFVIMRADGVSASIKASHEDQSAMIAADPETFSFAQYTGRFGWVSVRLATAHAGEIGDLIAEAWRRTAPKRLVASFDALR